MGGSNDRHMIRFSFDPKPEDELAFEHFSLEGDNTRGYVLLAWNTVPTGTPEQELPEMLQMWFETLGEAMKHCVNELGIMKDQWHAPTASSPPSQFDSVRRRRAGDDSTVLNPNNVKKREEK